MTVNWDYKDDDNSEETLVKKIVHSLKRVLELTRIFISQPLRASVILNCVLQIDS